MTQGHSVLVVEDEADIREMLALLLEGEGYTVHQAADGRQAIDQLEQLTPDLVLLDIMMPELDGHVVCAWARAQDRLDATRIVMLTAKNDITHIARAHKAGADGFVAKPFDVEHFLEVLAFRLRGDRSSFYHRGAPVIILEDAPDPEQMTARGSIVFLDLIEPDEGFSVVSQACESHSHCLMSLWQQDLGDTVRTTALLGFDQPERFGDLLNRLVSDPRISLEDCSVYRDFHEVPWDIMAGGR